MAAPLPDLSQAWNIAVPTGPVARVDAIVSEAAERVYKELGSEHAEVVYARALEQELAARSCDVRREVEIPVFYTDSIGIRRSVGVYKADHIVTSRHSGETVIVEVKHRNCTDAVHRDTVAQLVRYANAYANAAPSLSLTHIVGVFFPVLSGELRVFSAPIK